MLAVDTATQARWPLRDIVGETFITAAEYAAAESAENNLTGTFVVEGSESSNITIEVTKGEPGLNLTAFFLKGEDQLANFTSARLYPTGLYSNSRSLSALYNTKGNVSVAFRQASGLPSPPPVRAAVEGGKGGLYDNTFSWMNVGSGGAVDDFIFDLEDTRVVGIKNPGYEVESTINT